MRPILSICTLAFVIAATPARAEKHVFVVANNPDGYGVDRCLASGESCGAAVAKAYCEAQDYVTAISFRRVDRGETTAVIPTSTSACTGTGCEFVAIECTR
jgi:uncharacterized DUF497 family protein